MVELGTIDGPPVRVDPEIFILSGGKLQDPETAKHTSVTLGKLFESYRNDFPQSAKEAGTRITENIYLDHLARLLGEDLALVFLKARQYLPAGKRLQRPRLRTG